MKKKIAIPIIVVLVISNIGFFLAWKGEQSDRLYYDYAVPHIELISAMGFYGIDTYNGQVVTSQNRGDIAFGKISGFVVFSNPEDQPRGARQYYTIEATDSYDSKGNQIFTLTDTMKLNAISPRSFDKEMLEVISNTDQFVTLQNESGQSFRINKRTDEVAITDAQGDMVSLITNQSDYKDFIFDFLK
jgi:hypothetical protein